MASPLSGQRVAAHGIGGESPSWSPRPQSFSRSKPPRSGERSPGVSRSVRVRMGAGGGELDVDDPSPPARVTPGMHGGSADSSLAASSMAGRTLRRDVVEPPRRAGAGATGSPAGAGTAGARRAGGEVDEEAKTLLQELKEATAMNRSLQIKSRCGLALLSGPSSEEGSQHSRQPPRR